ncbi:MAG: tetratricopeptide repeat protein [Methylococcales bacterium]|nr:tetratricopeptide repeat protein [Methylococcales bacterium]
MINPHQKNNKKLVLFSILSSLLLLSGCDKEEDSNEHLQKSAEYINSGEFEKAKLEMKTATQSGKESAETYYYMALLNEKEKQFREMKGNLLKTVELAPTYKDARIKLGKVQLLFGENDAAMSQADSVLKDDPKNREAWALKASVLIKQKKQDEALAIIENILKVEPNHSDALSLKALIYMEREDYPKALALIEAAKKSDEDNLSLDFFKIRVHAKSQNITAIMEDFEKLVVAHPENQDFKITLAKIYVQAGKIKDAEKLLAGLIEGEPNNVQHILVMLDFLTATAPESVDEKYLEFTGQHKDQARILLELAKWMVGRNNIKMAKSTLNRVIELEENTPPGLSAKILLAKIALNNKDYEGVKTIVDKILAENSSYDEAVILQAKLFIIKEQYDQAITLLNKVVWSKGQSEEANMLLGETYLLKGDKKLADKLYINALEANPANIQALSYLLEKAMQAKDVNSAKQMLERALTLMPDNIVLLEKLANANLFEHDWEAAKANIQKIANLPNPLANDIARYLLGKVYQDQENYPKAIEIYKELLSKFPENSEALGNMARCYEKLHKRAEMIAFLENILGKNPQNLSAGMLLGDLYLMDSKLDKGVELLSKLIKDNPKTPQLYVLLANTKLAAKNNTGAIDVYLDGLKANPENIKLGLSLAFLYEEIGDYDSAVIQYEALISKNPNLDIAINSLAVVLSEHYASEEKLTKAVELSQRFKDSSQPYYKDTYAWALIKQGNVSEGLKLLNQIIVASPDVAIFRYHLGVAHYKNGNNSSAINEINQAIALGAKNNSFPDKKSAETLLAEIIAKTRGN